MPAAKADAPEEVAAAAQPPAAASEVLAAAMAAAMGGTDASKRADAPAAAPSEAAPQPKTPLKEAITRQEGVDVIMME